MEMRFEGKTALITGAASGMGLLCSENLVKEGANVLMVDVNGEKVKELAEKLSSEGPGRALGFQCDVRHYEEDKAACDKAVEIFGSIDILANFAGGAACRIWNVGPKEFPDVPIEVYDWGIDVNLKAQFYFDHIVANQMRKQGSGVIVNIGSITGAEGSEQSVDYAAAKSGAMYGLTQSIALYGAKYGFRCVCVSPGPVLTRPGMARMKTAMGRAADPQEIIDTVLFLASDKSSFTTGVNVLVDGGRLVALDRT